MELDTSTISYRHWSFDRQRRLLHVGGEAVHLQRGVVNLMLFLIDHEGQVVSKEDLIKSVWGGRAVSDAAIYNRVGALRRALRDDGPERCIRWEYGDGLRFTRPDQKFDAIDGIARRSQSLHDTDDSWDVRQTGQEECRFDGASPVEDWQTILGTYHTIYRTPSWPNAIKIGVSMLKQQGDQVMVLTSEHGEDPKFGIRQRARYRGNAVFIDGRLFVTEQNSRPPRSICLTTLDAPHAYRPNIMTGLMQGSSWRLGGAPYATRVVWRRVPPDMSLREALDKSGPYPEDSDEIDAEIRRGIGSHCLTFYERDSTL